MSTEEQNGAEVHELTAEDEFCPNMSDGTHCYCWWDGDTCCACESPGLTDDQKRLQGMDILDAESCPEGCDHKVENQQCNVDHDCAVMGQREDAAVRLSMGDATVLVRETFVPHKEAARETMDLMAALSAETNKKD